jgi:hypothetical protein
MRLARHMFALCSLVVVVLCRRGCAETHCTSVLRFTVKVPGHFQNNNAETVSTGGSQRRFAVSNVHWTLFVGTTSIVNCSHFKHAAIQRPHRVKTLQSTTVIEIMMNDKTKPQGMRILNRWSTPYSTPTGSSDINIQVFWVVNIILITVTVAILVWCARRQQRLREQQDLRPEQDKKETPEQRRTKLLQSFHRNNTHSVSRCK